MIPADIEKLEIELILEALCKRHGYDFRDYARASLKRRLLKRMQGADLHRLSEMIPRILHDDDFLDKLLQDLSITVTEMFRDPEFYRALREIVIPVLKTYPFIKIWHAGCSTGEEVYSMAILLEEEGLYDRAQIYATDYNPQSLDTARAGIYAIDNIRKFTANYQKSGGLASFADYYHAKYDSAKISDRLKKKITFSYHNLVTDQVFGEMNLIICRNVLIYFNKNLKNRALSLFTDSCCHRGFLCLGSRETVKFTKIENKFEQLYGRGTIYRKK